MSNTVDIQNRSRVAIFDIVRGATILSMVAFHACYDAAYLYGYELPWFTDPIIQNVWRSSISWTFLFVAGWMTQHSRSNLRRGLIYAGAALVVWFATTVASVDTAVSFGILFCMAASTLIYSALESLFRRLGIRSCLLCAATELVLFFVTYAIPQSRYAIDGLSWLGFPSPMFTSGDYYPLIPFSFMYLCGAFCARAYLKASSGTYPSWAYHNWCRPLSCVGKASLIIYLAHQPLLIVIFELLAIATT